MVHYSKYSIEFSSDNGELINDIEGDLTFDSIDSEIVEIIYNEGNCDIDPYKLVVDCGCP